MKSKRLISALLCCLMLTTLLPTTATAAAIIPTCTWGASSRQSISQTEPRAVLARILTVSGSASINNVEKVGIRLYDASGNLVASKQEVSIPSGNYIEMWYDVTDELGYTLTPGATYTYQFFADIRLIGAGLVSCSSDKYTFTAGKNSATTYTVTLDATGGSVYPGSITVRTGGVYGQLPTPTRPGYQFNCWSTDPPASSGGTGNTTFVQKITASSPVTTQRDHTLYAHWSKTNQTYTVAFNANGGSVSTSSKTVTAGESYGTLPTPVHSGYTFDGWYTSSSGGSRITSSTTVTQAQDHTLYAHWIRAVETCTVTFNANGGSVSTSSKTVTAGESYGDLPTPTRKGYTFDGWYTSSSGGNRITSSTTVTQTHNHTLYAHWASAVDPYNLGDETYSFKNYGDSDSVGGHCFGMSITSAGYYNHLLDIGKIGGNANTSLYSFLKTQTVTAPVCYYQGIQQKKYTNPATVAGGSFYLNNRYNIASDWQAVVNYVRNHNYDNTGLLQIGFRKNNEGGHAINFLRYENVNGQDRIYAYDNNYPTQETYFYQDSSGSVRQAPVQTFSGTIDCIALRDCRIYFNLVGDFDATHVLYMAKDAANVEGEYTYSYMEAGFSEEEYIMYELPANVNEVVIIPKRDNATIIYMDTEYSFGEVTSETRGVLRLASKSEGSAGANASFQVYEGDLGGHPFTDVKQTDSFDGAVRNLYQRGIVKGVSATLFDPQGSLTRAQLVTMLHRMDGSPNISGSTFSDVPAGTWYHAGVEWAASKGIVNGYGNGRFGPNDMLTREQMFTILFRYAQYKGYDVSKRSTTRYYNDTDKISSYALDAIEWAHAMGMTRIYYNNSYFQYIRPRDIATRAGVAEALWLFIYQYEK